LGGYPTNNNRKYYNYSSIPSIPTSVAAEAAENIALAANPGNAPVNIDSEGNQYVINKEGEAVYLGVPTFADNLAAAGLVEVNGVWTYPS